MTRFAARYVLYKKIGDCTYKRTEDSLLIRDICRVHPKTRHNAIGKESRGDRDEKLIALIKRCLIRIDENTTHTHILKRYIVPEETYGNPAPHEIEESFNENFFKTYGKDSRRFSMPIWTW